MATATSSHVAPPSQPLIVVVALEVAIIGAGPAGLVSAKTLLSHDIRNIAVFEETSCAGGLWNRQERLKVPCCRNNNNSNGFLMSTIESSSQPVYEHLRANFPKDMSSFLGYPFPAQTEFFPDADTVAFYYQGYAKQFQINQYIHYSTRVEKCFKRPEDNLWVIQTTTTTTKNKNTQNDNRKHEKREFLSKRLLVCNGHFRKAFVPDVPGLNHFSGRILHSSSFGSPNSKNELFHNKTVLIVGGYISGSDIAKILHQHGTCARIIVSVREYKPTHNFLLKRLKQQGAIIVRPGIDHISLDGTVHFSPPKKNKKGQVEEGYIANANANANTTSSSRSSSSDEPFVVVVTESPDVILFATGYRYHFPFLAPGGKFLRDPEGFQMARLYKRVLFVDDPSLAFIGVTNHNLSPALMMEYQAQWYAKMVVAASEKNTNIKNTTTTTADGPMLLLKVSREEMEEEIESRRKDPTQDALLFKFPSYCNSLAKDAGIRGYWMQLLLDRLPLHLRSLWVRRHPSVYWIIMGMFGIPGGVAGLGLVSYSLSRSKKLQFFRS